ncbi:MAG: 16S rRNA (guanine(527)-N(7))-methyltransferase RsmG [Candidatus Eisenbacteria bacterium]|nr:16S rRNA (guanine(527)-N(7))-methyltransferase RsmG [Candidatus Eisenbacteria bacterium]
MTLGAAAAGISQLAGEITESQASRLSEYVRLARKLGSRWNLMSPAALAGIEEHLIDSAALLRVHDPECGSLADLGSGGGLPGVVLAILRPRWRVTLVDSRRSKVVFLREAASMLDLGNAEVVHGRIEELQKGAFDTAVSRALGPVRKTLGPSLKTVRRGGKLILYKGPSWEEERAEAAEVAGEWGAAIAAEERVKLPGLSRATTFVTFELE